jgi:hypothetical protein
VVDETSEYIYGAGDTFGDLGGAALGASDVFVVKRQALNGS